MSEIIEVDIDVASVVLGGHVPVPGIPSGYSVLPRTYISLPGTYDDCVSWKLAFIMYLRRELDEVVTDGPRVIVWRQRPMVREPIQPDSEQYMARCRVGFYPPLSDEAIARLDAIKIIPRDPQ